MPPSRVARAPLRKPRTRRNWRALLRWVAWRRRARWTWRKLAAAPRAVRIAVAVASILAVFSAANVAYHVARKPTELFYPFSVSLDKTPAATWRQYGRLFHAYSTRAIPAELLAALAQVESDGNPVAQTYWRWRFAWNPFAIYAPASTSVGMYQMTDAAFDEARHYCVRGHAVVDDCWFTGLYTRVLPDDAIELAAVFLDRKVAEIRAVRPAVPASSQQLQDLAAMVQLCGIVPAESYARHHFHLAAGQHCGAELAATYLARVNAMARQFARLAVER